MYVRIRQSLFQLCRCSASDREGRRNLTEKRRGDIPSRAGPARLDAGSQSEIEIIGLQRMIIRERSITAFSIK